MKFWGLCLRSEREGIDSAEAKAVVFVSEF